LTRRLYPIILKALTTNRQRTFPTAKAVVLFLMSAFVLGQSVPVLSAITRDEVLFQNGQKLVGEIKGLDRGMLSFNTDETGTISVKWVKVVGLYSPARFRVEIGTGQILVGSLERASEEGKAVIATYTGKVLLALDLIVTIDPFEKKRLDRLRGEVSVGSSLQRAQRLTTLTMSADISYQMPKWRFDLSGDSYLSKQEAVETTTRNGALMTVQRDLTNRYVALGTTGFQQNTELGLSGRFMLGGGLGNRLVYTNLIILTVGAGAVAVDEKYSDAEASAQNVEALFTGRIDAFRHTFPKLDFILTTKVYPSLTDWGRVRLEFDTSFSYEILSDFYVGLDGFYSFDSRPPTEETSKRDYGISLSIRWKFNK
jgi:hypothetical protein